MHMYLFSRIILVYLKICFKKIFFNIFSPKSPSYIFFYSEEVLEDSGIYKF